MGWVVRELVKALLPTVVLPALVVGLIIYCFGFTLESLVAVLVFTQLYVAWAEVEVALRQTHLAALEYEPEFNIEAEELKEHQGSYIIKVGNMGRHAAWNIFILVSVKPCQEPGEETHVFKPVTSLAPGEAVDLATLTAETLSTCEIRVELDYETIYGEPRTILFVKNPGFPVFITTSTHRKPGILLNSLEELSLILTALTLPRKIRKYQEKNKEAKQPTQQA